MNKYINNEAPIYISYSRKDGKVVSELLNLLRDNGIVVYGDWGDIKHGSSITDFERELCNAKMVVMVVSESYFKSMHCMYEYACIRQNHHLEKLWIVKCGVFSYSDSNFRRDLMMYWGGKYACLENESYEMLTPIEHATLENGCYIGKDTVFNIRYLPQFLDERVYFRDTDDLYHLVDSIVDSIKNISNPNAQLPTLSFIPSNDKLTERDDKVDCIYQLLQRNQIVNIIGLGGCGKTSLTELLVLKYKDMFDQITRVFVNDDFCKTVLDSYSDIFKVDNYYDVIRCFENYSVFKDKYNLFIIDINEKAIYHQIENELMRLIKNKRLVTWKILIASRENILRNAIPVVHADDFTNKDNFVFAKELFFAYLREDKHNLYSDEELKNLFLSLYYVPMLIMHLAYFLNKNENLTYKDISNILEIDDNTNFMHKNFIVRASDYETIGTYLAKLSYFKGLDELHKSGNTLRNIIRHLMIWPSDYYSAQFIIDFIVDKDNTSKQEEENIKTGLDTLSNALYLSFKTDYNGDLSYKLHGLLAHTFREQVFEDDDNKDFRDYSTYLKNVDAFDSNYEHHPNETTRSIITYSLANFVSYDADYLLGKARLYGNGEIFNRAMKIKVLKLKFKDISDDNIYNKLKPYKNVTPDKMYYQWRNNAPSNAVLSKPKGEKVSFAVNGINLNFVYVEGCTFYMGSLEEDDEKPVHSVTLSDFYISDCPVTQKLWMSIMGCNPSNFKNEDYPVENVSWNDSLDFIVKLSEMTGKKFRLPTEAEWEYAAKGGQKQCGYKYSGSNNIDEVAWYAFNADCRTFPVGMKKSNELGIYDMTGNVWEWCQDWYGDYSQDAILNPMGQSSGSCRVLRGGSWADTANWCRMSARHYMSPECRSNNVGFRLVISAIDKKEV
ncbi:MAG: SUMF1/EgtB/PvdO family nonheme iron enzyme [Bacteroidales bacterium]|nr:SUMF1/EgtB/PvdO family nonheme iron enzyme [Bacteroidales bacterium]